jgi:hypothetical protein
VGGGELERGEVEAEADAGEEGEQDSAALFFLCRTGGDEPDGDAGDQESKESVRAGRAFEKDVDGAWDCGGQEP